MTIEMCLSICRSKGFPFSGLEWSCECHCGHEPENGFEWAWSSKCDDRCAGDSNQVCGGSNALSLWTTPPKNPSGLCINDYPENQRVLNELSITGLENMTIEYCHSFCQGELRYINQTLQLFNHKKPRNISNIKNLTRLCNTTNRAN